MRIFVNARFLTQPLSGVQRYAIECSRQIKKLHPDTIFVAPPDILHKSIAEEFNVQITGNKTGHKWEQFDLPRYLIREGSPPLLCPSNTAPLFYKNTFLTLHDLAFYHHPEWNSKAFSLWYNFLIPRLIQKSRHIFTVSNTMKEEIIKYYRAPPSKISVTYNGISQNMLSAGGQGEIVKEKIILLVGSFNLRKNHHTLIKAFLDSKLKNEYQLALVGDKNKVFREAGIDKHTLESGNVKIYPQLGEQELIELYQKAEVLVSLSVYEGFGIPLLEGLFFNCKVVCSDIPVYRELFNNYVSFCDPYNVDGVKKVLTETIKTHSKIDFKETQLFEKYSYASTAKVIVDKMRELTHH